MRLGIVLFFLVLALVFVGPYAFNNSIFNGADILAWILIAGIVRIFFFSDKRG